MNYSSINIEKQYPRSSTTISRAVYSLVDNETQPDGVCMPKCYANSESIVARYFYDDCISIGELLPLCTTAMALIKILKGIKASLFYLNEEYGLSTNNFLFTVDEIFMTAQGDILLLPSIAKLAVPNDVEHTVFNTMLKLSGVSGYGLERIKLALDSYYSIEGLKLGAFESALDMATDFELDEHMEQGEVPLFSIVNELNFDDSKVTVKEPCNIPNLPVPPEDPFMSKENSDFSIFGAYDDTENIPMNNNYNDEYYSSFIQNTDISSWSELNNMVEESYTEDDMLDMYSEAVLFDIATQEVYPIYTNPFTIGKAIDNSLRLNSQEVSDYHAIIFVDNGIYYVQDENSQYYTYIDGEKLEQNGAYQLSDNCLLTFADISLVFKFGN